MKTAMITGANRGLGKALAEVFSKKGCRLILHSRSGMNIDCTTCDDFTIVNGDLRELKTISLLTQAAFDQELDILINNAGVYLQKEFFNITDKEIKQIMAVNLLVPMELTKCVWPLFKQKQSGIVVNINSIASKHSSNGETAYSASKCGLRGFSNALQFDATKYGIRILNINFGAMNTCMAASRNNKNKLIDPLEAARLVYTLCMEDYPSLRITEIDVHRRVY